MGSEPIHSFAVCAYGQSPYLRSCLESVLNQTMPGSEVFISTSTPSDWLDEIAQDFGLPVYINTGDRGIGQDWNYAYSCASGKFVTIAHQDDIYCPDYAQTAVDMLSVAKMPLIFFCNYAEIRGGSIQHETLNLRIKRHLLRRLRNGRNAENIKVRRSVLSYGCAICCPSVTLVAANCPEKPYRTDMKCSLDWDTWDYLSRFEGSFLYSSEVLMYHRIHEDSATTKLISDNTRSQEDKAMYERFWPKPIAHLLAGIYTASLNSNNL